MLPARIKIDQLASLDLKNLKPFGKPVVEIGDISTYLKDTHEIRFNYSGANKLKKLKDTLGGKPFVIFVNDEAIYTGAFWSYLYSLSFNGVYLDLDEIEGDYPKVQLRLGYPSKKFFTGKDPRSDERIFDELEKGGFLYEQLEVIGKCKKIVATGKRHASWVFTFSLDSTVQGNYPGKEISFEKFADFGGNQLRALLEVEKDSRLGENSEISFNSKKEIVLKFEVQVKPTAAKINLIDFFAR